MPHGAPDDSDVVKAGAAYRLDDMAELAARLGSPVTFNRFGDVVWLDTFEDGLGGWYAGATDAASAIYIQGTRTMSGGCAVEMASATIAPDYIGMWKHFAYKEDTRLGFGCTYACDGDGTTVTIRLVYYDGTRVYLGKVEVDHASGEVSYLNSGGVETVVGALGKLDITGYVWYPVKLVIDTATGEFVGFRFGPTNIDMSGLALWQGPATDAPRCIASVYFFCDDALDHSLYIDNCVFTVNEF